MIASLFMSTSFSASSTSSFAFWTASWAFWISSRRGWLLAWLLPACLLKCLPECLPACLLACLPLACSSGPPSPPPHPRTGSPPTAWPCPASPRSGPGVCFGGSCGKVGARRILWGLGKSCGFRVPHPTFYDRSWKSGWDGEVTWEVGTSLSARKALLKKRAIAWGGGPLGWFWGEG